MIVFFHGAYFLFKFILRNYKRFQFHKERAKLLAAQSTCSIPQKNEDIETNLSFDPPVYRQRYSAIQQKLLDYRWKKSIKKVVDFGCAEFGMFMYLKNLLSVEKIVFVDILEDLLVESNFRIRPLTVDYLKRRANPLIVEVFVGSVSSPDENLLNTDAVIAIELIEHLYPDTLDALPYNIFAFIQPSIAIFTTPNADFNVLFPNFKKFRHYDHKFEWSREQFESWAINVTHRFPQYTVYFEGVGYGPSGTEHLGACSQMAVFIKSTIAYNSHQKSSSSSSLKKRSSNETDEVVITGKDSREKYSSYESFGVCTYHSYSAALNDYEIFPKKNNEEEDKYYKFIESVEFPFDNDGRSPEEVLLHELLYTVHLLGSYNGRFYKSERDRSEIPLVNIVCQQQKFITTVPEASAILQKAGYKIETCVDFYTNEPEKCLIYEPEMETSRSSSNTEESEYLGESDWESVDQNWDENVRKHVDLGAQDNVENVVQDIIKDLDSFPSQSSSEWNTDETTTTTKENSERCRPDSTYCDSGFLNSQSCKSGEVSENEGNPETAENDSNIAESSPIIPLEPELPKETDTTLKNGLLKDVNRTKKNSSSKDESKGATSDDFSMGKKEKWKDVNNSFKKSPSSQEGDDLLVAGGSNVKRRKKQKKNCHDDKEQHGNSEEDGGEERGNVVDGVNPEIHLVNEVLEQLPQVVVENGDLVNNNRDYEGNNYPNAPQNGGEFQHDHDENQNREENELQEDIENRNGNEGMQQPPNHRNEIIELREAEEGADELPEVAHASREALFDPNSQVDLLGEYSNPPSGEEANGGVQNIPQDAVLVVGINPVDEDNGAVLPPLANPFPNWLLHLLENEDLGTISLHDEPHFYCQGDGIGVHPSIIEVDLDDDSDTESDESSHSNVEENYTLQTTSNSHSDMMSFLFETDSQKAAMTQQNSSSSNNNNNNNMEETDKSTTRPAHVESSLSGQSVAQPSTTEMKTKIKKLKNKKKETASTSSNPSTSEKGNVEKKDPASRTEDDDEDEENFVVSLSLLSNMILVRTEQMFQTLGATPAPPSSETTTTLEEDRARMSGNAPGEEKEDKEDDAADPT